MKNYEGSIYMPSRRKMSSAIRDKMSRFILVAEVSQNLLLILKKNHCESDSRHGLSQIRRNEYVLSIINVDNNNGVFTIIE